MRCICYFAFPLLPHEMSVLGVVLRHLTIRLPAVDHVAMDISHGASKLDIPAEQQHADSRGPARGDPPLLETPDRGVVGVRARFARGATSRPSPGESAKTSATCRGHDMAPTRGRPYAGPYGLRRRSGLLAGTPPPGGVCAQLPAMPGGAHKRLLGVLPRPRVSRPTLARPIGCETH